MGKYRALAAAAALTIATAACGDDDDAGTATTAGAAATTTAGGAATTTASAGGDCTLDTPLKIGYAADFSDLGGFADKPGSEAAKVQVDLINEAGGVGGKPIEYEIKELPTDPSAAQRAAQELLDDGVNAIIGPPFSYNGGPMIDTVAGKAPVISNASTDLSLADPSRGAFLMSFSDPVQGAAAAEFASKGGAKTAVTFSSPDDAYFTNTTAAFTDAFEHGGGTVTKDFTFGLADDDFSSQVNELATLEPKPDVLYTAMVMPGAGVLLQQLQAAGLGDVHVIGADAFDATVVWSAGEVADGVSFTAHTFPRDDNGVQAFLDAAKDAGVTIDTVSFGALAADVVQVFAAAAEAACSVEPAALTAAISALQDLEVTTGTVSYAGTDGVPDKDVVILTVEGAAPTFTEAFRPSYIPS
jgi:branched-chain amino acid transport system substrate-binding protein